MLTFLRTCRGDPRFDWPSSRANGDVSRETDESVSNFGFVSFRSLAPPLSGPRRVTVTRASRCPTHPTRTATRPRTPPRPLIGGATRPGECRRTSSSRKSRQQVVTRSTCPRGSRFPCRTRSSRVVWRRSSTPPAANGAPRSPYSSPRRCGVPAGRASPARRARHRNRKRKRNVDRRNPQKKSRRRDPDARRMRRKTNFTTRAKTSETTTAIRRRRRALRFHPETLPIRTIRTTRTTSVRCATWTGRRASPRRSFRRLPGSPPATWCGRACRPRRATRLRTPRARARERTRALLTTTTTTTE